LPQRVLEDSSLKGGGGGGNKVDDLKGKEKSFLTKQKKAGAD